MKRVFILAVPILAFVLLIKPATNQLNSQKSIDQNNMVSGYNDKTPFGYFHGTKVLSPIRSVAQVIDTDTQTNVLSSKSQKNKDKRIEVDLAKQKLYAYSGSKKEYSFLVSTGKWGKTPTGEFRIWAKLEYTLMTGGSKALNTYYYLPNVPYTMYFYNQGVPKSKGYGIHGAYWHNNFGHPMSHGCVNMKPDDAKTLFNWASAETKDSSGTKIIIYGTAPNN